MIKKMNNRGSILQIVLILFLVMVASISIIISIVSYQYQLYKQIDILMKQKNLEIMLLNYYMDTMQNDFLLSDSIKSDDYSIEYQVDDMGSYYSILTDVNIEHINYRFYVDIDTEYYKIINFEYMEGNS